jgi:hypothetical protein
VKAWAQLTAKSGLVAMSMPLLTLVLGLAARASYAETPLSRAAVPSTQVAPARQSLHHYPRVDLEKRAASLSRLLGLSESQQSELRKVLASQREQIVKLWSEQSVPAAYRVSVMRGINDATEARIRNLLTEGQRKIYIQPKPRETPETSQQDRLNEWLSKTGR